MPAPTPDGREWIGSVCRRFTDALEQPLRFEPADSSPPLNARSGPPDDRVDPVGTVEISDGVEKVGRLSLGRPPYRSRERSHRSLLTLADIAAEMISRRIEVERELTARTMELARLADVGRSLQTPADLPATVLDLVRTTVDVTGFRSAGFFLLGADADELRLRVAHCPEAVEIPRPTRLLSDGPPDLSALVGNPVCIAARSDRDWRNWMPEDSPRGVCVAVQSEAGPMGTLWAFERRDVQPSDRQIHVMESMAARIGAALERNVLLDESRIRRRMQKDLREAAEGARICITENLPTDAGFEVAGLCTSRHELGGDLCELIPLDTNRVIVAVGDGTGDSVPAALIMTAVRGALRTAALGGLDDALRTDAVVARINAALYDITPAHQFMSLIYGVIDTETMRFRYTNAGHPQPILMRGGEVSTLDSHGLLVGVLPDSKYKRSEVDLEPGDVLVMFSDGVTEATSASRRLFRSEGVEDVLRQCPATSADAVLESILQRLEAHTQGAGEGDDSTLLVLRINSD